MERDPLDEKFAGILEKTETPFARKEAVEYLAKIYNLSARSIYRKARAGGWKSGRAVRSDKGSGVIT